MQGCLLGLLHESVVPRLVAAGLAHFRQGGVVTVGGTEALRPAASQGGAGIVQRKLRTSSASTVRLSAHGVELLGERKTKAIWAWNQVWGTPVQQGEVRLVPHAGKPVLLLPMVCSTAMLLPSLIEGIWP